MVTIQNLVHNAYYVVGSKLKHSYTAPHGIEDFESTDPFYRLDSEVTKKLGPVIDKILKEELKEVTHSDTDTIPPSDTDTIDPHTIIPSLEELITTNDNDILSLREQLNFPPNDIQKNPYKLFIFDKTIMYIAGKLADKKPKPGGKRRTMKRNKKHKTQRRNKKRHSRTQVRKRKSMSF
jgi:hypothetical protein